MLGYLVDDLRKENLAATDGRDIEAIAARIDESLREICRQAARLLCLGDLDEDALTEAGYPARLWRCAHHHWKQSLETDRPDVAQVLRHLGTEGFRSKATGRLILEEVFMAHALGRFEEKAAELFEITYMPPVRAAAFRVGGSRAVERFENLVAELTIPRGDRPPKIATYVGKTSLLAWLRAVVTNAWITHQRRELLVTVDNLDERTTAASSSDGADAAECEERLKPIWVTSAANLAAEDRLLLQMVMLDQVPQKSVATLLGIHPGNVTRRRDRAIGNLFAQIQAAIGLEDSSTRSHECLELVLSGDARESGRRIADILAEAVRGGETAK